VNDVSLSSDPGHSHPRGLAGWPSATNTPKAALASRRHGADEVTAMGLDAGDVAPEFQVVHKRPDAVGHGASGFNS
jgi:hypothetical protein